MIPFEEALEIILNETGVLPETTVPLSECLGHTLSQTISSPFDLPLFDNSAMDGFGVKLGDLKEACEQQPVKLTLAGVLQAGGAQAETLSDGQAIQIMTGAPVPESIDAVVMKEFCETENGHVLVKRAAKPGENIRRKGEEIKSGQAVLKPGTPITPAVVGMLATLGYAEIPVYQKPVVGIVVTGDELIEPGEKLGAGKIYNSNSHALRAACMALGIETVFTAHAADDPKALRERLCEILSRVDALITVGGVSVGDYDFVKDVLEQIGVETKFWRINIKPGKPVLFGKKDRKLVLGLPGNPVSALVTFHLLARPALMKLVGRTNYAPQTFRATLGKTLKQKPGRRSFVRAVATPAQNGLTVTPTEGQESHMMLGLASANCLVVFPEDKDSIAENETVEILWL